MKTRKDVLNNKGYWTADIQLKLYDSIRDFMKIHNMNQTQLAKHLKVTKGYITQILNGDFDHKISKLVDLSLAIGKVPNLYLEDVDKYVEDDEMDISHISQRERPKITLSFGTSMNFNVDSQEVSTFKVAEPAPTVL
jgi:transcriptional regulator with XRE-family HTH domain